MRGFAGCDGHAPLLATRSDTLVGGSVWLPAEVLVEHLPKERLVGSGSREQGHGRAQLLRVDATKDLLCAGSLRLDDEARALLQPRSKHRMIQIRLRLLQ